MELETFRKMYNRGFLNEAGIDEYIDLLTEQLDEIKK